MKSTALFWPSAVSTNDHVDLSRRLLIPGPFSAMEQRHASLLADCQLKLGRRWPELNGGVGYWAKEGSTAILTTCSAHPSLRPCSGRRVPSGCHSAQGMRFNQACTNPFRERMPEIRMVCQFGRRRAWIRLAWALRQYPRRRRRTKNACKMKVERDPSKRGTS